MVRYSFREPYTKTTTVTRKKDGTRRQKTVYHTNFPARNKSGFYQIKENGLVVYIGFSGKDIYRTMYRHFQKWEHNLQDVIRYNIHKHKYTVSVTYCSPSEAEVMEKKLIKEIKPRDNTLKAQIPGGKYTAKTLRKWHSVPALRSKFLPGDSLYAATLPDAPF